MPNIHNVIREAALFIVGSAHREWREDDGTRPSVARRDGVERDQLNIM